MAAYIPYAFAAISAYSALESADAQATGLRLQATQAELEGRANALRYNQQAFATFQQGQKLNAVVRARAAAGGIDPTTGSPLTIQQYNAVKAGEEYMMAKENAEGAIAGGLANSQALYSAASSAKRLGYLNAITSAGTSFFMASQFASPGASAPGLGPTPAELQFSGPF